MWAGKTKKLKNLVEHSAIKNEKFIIIKAKIDDRYTNDNNIYSHKTIADSTHETFNAFKDHILQVKNLMDINDLNNINTIYIDEGHFFSDIVEFIKKYYNRKNIYVTALNSDFLMKPFKNIAECVSLITYQNVIELHAICKCTNDAYYTEKTTYNYEKLCDLNLNNSNSNSNIEVGGDEIYKPRCYNCHPLTILSRKCKYLSEYNTTLSELMH